VKDRNNHIEIDLGLLSTQLANPLVESPIKVLAEWFFTDCESKNLQKKTIEFYKLKLRYLSDTLGDRRPEEISTVHLRTLLMALKEQRKWSVQNTNHCVQVWKVFFNYLEREEIIEKNPTRRLEKLRQERTFPKVFTREQIAAILGVIPDTFPGYRDKVMIMLMLDSGIRLTELLSITTEDIDLAHGVIRIFGKGRKERFVPFESTVRKMLLRYLALRQAALGREAAYENSLWISSRKTRLSQPRFSRVLQLYGEKAGVENVHPHRFRHSFATQYLRNGGSPQMLQLILRHAGPQMTQYYVHLADMDAKLDHRRASPVEAWKLTKSARRAF
jgi:integrase/recombinase XerD